MTQCNSILRLNAFELSLHLGWSENERSQKQTILVDINLQFPEMPKACLTDELNDTYCYHTLINHILEQVETKEFRLIEHLGHTLYTLIKKTIPDSTHLHIVVYKNLAVVGLSGKAVFEYGEQI